MENEHHSPDIGDKVVEVQHLAKAFGSNVVLRDINFSLHRGETAAVVGKSGSGKSVLIKCLVRLINSDSGLIEVLGKDISRLTDSELNNLRRKVGFLFQGGALYDSMSVRENLEFPLMRQLEKPGESEANELVEEVLEGVGLLNAIDKMPDELSGGMRKRIALARTLILKPDIILYDEPTTGLDPVTSREISELINKMKERYHIASLVITHDIACVKMTANRIFVLSDGVFIASAPYEDLIKRDQEEIKEFFREV